MSKRIMVLALFTNVVLTASASAQDKVPASILFGGQVEMPLERTRRLELRDQSDVTRSVLVICALGRIYVQVDGEFYALNALAMQRLASTKLISGREVFSISGAAPGFVRAAAPRIAQICAFE